MEFIVKKFIEYVKINTTPDAESTTSPTTEIQLDLARVLVEDMKNIGLVDVDLDENGNVTGRLPKNTDKNIPTIGFLAHMDTAPSFNGTNVNPRVVENYQGGAIELNKEANIYLRPEEFPELENYKGQDIIVTDGLTLLGADNKAGIVEILDAMRHLIAHPEIEHGDIKVGFTPDEEIGRGAHLFNVEKFAADFAYTVDGGEIGELEYENFNASSAKIHIKGVDIHPGTSKNKMINSMLIAMELQGMLPVEQRPEYTEMYEGFFLLMNFQGSVENTTMNYILRDHDKGKLSLKKKILENAVEYLRLKYQGAKIELEIQDSYYNMKEIIEPKMYIIDIAKKSMEEVGVKPIMKPTRGGTDGSILSFRGLPCPNLFTGGHNFHGKYEYIPVGSMKKAVGTIVQIIKNSKELEI